MVIKLTKTTCHFLKIYQTDNFELYENFQPENKQICIRNERRIVESRSCDHSPSDLLLPSVARILNNQCSAVQAHGRVFPTLFTYPSRGGGTKERGEEYVPRLGARTKGRRMKILFLDISNIYVQHRIVKFVLSGECQNIESMDHSGLYRYSRLCMDKDFV